MDSYDRIEPHVQSATIAKILCTPTYCTYTCGLAFLAIIFEPSLSQHDRSGNSRKGKFSLALRTNGYIPITVHAYEMDFHFHMAMRVKSNDGDIGK